MINFRFVFMALMEYCLVNIVLGDADMPPKPINKKKFDFSFRVNIVIILILHTPFHSPIIGRN